MRWYQTSVGRKMVMAFTGLIMVGFVIVHMLGNFSTFAGADALNNYAAKLRMFGPGLWLFRLVMLGAVLVHLYLGVKLTMENSAARPVRYKAKTNLRTGVAAETMIYTGFLLAAFVIYHLLHYTVRVVNPEFAGMVLPDGHHNVFGMVVAGFSSAFTVGIYVVAMIVLLLHLSHGISSTFQSLGLNTESVQPLIEKAGKLAAFALLLGFIAVPLSVILGIVK